MDYATHLIFSPPCTDCFYFLNSAALLLPLLDFIRMEYAWERWIEPLTSATCLRLLSSTFRIPPHYCFPSYMYLVAFFMQWLCCVHLSRGLAAQDFLLQFTLRSYFFLPTPWRLLSRARSRHLFHTNWLWFSECLFYFCWSNLLLVWKQILGCLLCCKKYIMIMLVCFVALINIFWSWRLHLVKQGGMNFINIQIMLLLVSINHCIQSVLFTN